MKYRIRRADGTLHTLGLQSHELNSFLKAMGYDPASIRKRLLVTGKVQLEDDAGHFTVEEDRRGIA